MTLEQLKVLACIVETGSLSRAAAQMHKTQPALSMAVKKLESEYGFKVLSRDGYRLSLTPQGKTFYRKAQEILLNAEQLDTMGKYLGSGNEPVIRLAYDQACPLPLIANVLKKAQLDFPDTEFRIYGQTRFRSLEMLANQEVDLAISPWWPTLYALGDLESFTISHLKILLVASPELFPDHLPQKVAELKTKVHLGVEESGIRIDSDKLATLTGCREWKTRDIHTLKQLLLSGLGWSFIPESVVSEELAQGTLVQLKPLDLEFSVEGEIRLVRREQYTLGPVASALWQAFSQQTKLLSLKKT